MKIFIERPIATAMAFLALTVLGVYSFLNIPIEMPVTKEQFPMVYIDTPWVGMPPEIIQTQLTSPLEEKVSTVKGVRKIESSHTTGVAPAGPGNGSCQATFSVLLQRVGTSSSWLMPSRFGPRQKGLFSQYAAPAAK